MVERTQLKTERLLLRPLKFEDLDDVLAYAVDEEWSKYLIAVESPYTRRSGEEYMASAVLTSWQERPIFAIELDRRVIGGINLTYHREHRIAEVGWAVARALWGKGLAPEAAGAVIDWGFENFDIVKVFATADARNLRSIRVMRSWACSEKACCAAIVSSGGENVDEVVYGLLKEEWQRRSR